MDFEAPSNAAIADLIANYPLAWVLSPGAQPINATPLPLLGNYSDTGELQSLTGHLARRNPHFRELERNSSVTILFQGPNGYLSPSWQDNPRWGPTWNYAVIHITAELRLAPEHTDAALHRLVRVMEASHGGNWEPSLLGSRYAEMACHVIAFEATVIDVRARFKMGQDETPATLEQFIEKLTGSPLAACMEQCNRERLPEHGRKP